MATSWSDTAIHILRDGSVCPRCGARLVRIGECDACRADLGSAAALALWDEAGHLADAIGRWRTLADALPTLAAAPRTLAAAQPSPVAAAPPRAVPAAAARPAASGSQLSQQTVLAIAGAGLVAVAALVFTFLNPELTDFGTRSAVIGGVTAVFVVGAWLLARRGLRVSAETIGALGLVFVLLDVWAASTTAGPLALLLAAFALLVASAALALFARASGVLVWVWGALGGLLAVPAMVGYSSGDRWGVVAGHLGVIAVALTALWALPRLGPRLAAAAPALQLTATVAQVLAFAAVAGHVALVVAGGGTAALGGSAALAALAAFAALAARRVYPAAWSFAAGAFAALTVAALPVALDADSPWLMATLPAAAALAAVLLAAARGPVWPRGLAPAMARYGASAVVLAGICPAGAVLLVRLVSLTVPAVDREAQSAAIVGLAAVAAGAALVGLLSRGAERTRAVAVALWFAAAAAIMFSAWSALVVPAQVAVALGAAAVIAVVADRATTAGTPGVVRAPVLVAAHALVVVAATLSWANPVSAVLGGLAVIAVVALLGRTVAAAPRAVYVGVAYAYGVVLVATGVGLADLPPVAVIALTSAVASVLALAATLVARVAVAEWYAVLGVTAVPFVVGVAAVLAERSGWTALATGATFALAAVLVRSRRPGMTPALRVLAAALVVPSLAVTVVCACAQAFESSGSPIALPAIAAIVAVVLPSADALGRALERHGIARAEARSVRIAVESAALLTAAIATLLAVVRIAAGLETTLYVLALVGLGGAAAAVAAGRRHGWAIAAAAWTGALWCGYGIAGVTLPEAYLLPPAAAAAVVGAVAVALARGRERAGRALFSAGLVALVAPSTVVLALEGGAGRTVGLLAGAAAVVALGAAVARRERSWRLRRIAPLTGPAMLVATGAAASGVVQAARWGTAADPNPFVAEVAMLAPLALGLAATLVAAGAAHGYARATRSRSRWLYVPAVVFFAAAPMAGIEHSWLAIWTLWAVSLALLVGMLVTARLSLDHATVLPPVWLWFVLAWVAAVVGWSERELRVEAFSLPLGVAVLAAGVLAMRRPGRRPAGTTTIADWPAGFTGSWPLLAPGLVLTLAPSVLSTGTDPLTSRAVLVIGLALVAILVGSKLRLAAPFVLGIVVLPIENVVVFSVQIGRSIGAAPWWITLATAGAVLLVLAVTSERRDSAGQGVAARLRDLA